MTEQAFVSPVTPVEPVRPINWPFPAKIPYYQERKPSKW